MSRSLLVVTLLVALALNSSDLRGASVLLISSGDASNDAAVQSTLQAAGDTVTVGPTYNTFTGAGLSGYNAVFLNPNNTPLAFPDMPSSGQQALVNFVNHGGGLVAGADVAIYATFDPYSPLAHLLPVAVSVVDSINSPITLTALTSDPVLNAGLPSSITFAAKAFDTEHFLPLKSGATSYFATNQWTATFGGSGVAAGAAGWDYGAGRVFALSTFSDNTALGNADYDRLLANSINWAVQPTGGTPVPEPAPVAFYSASALGVWLVQRKRRRARAA